MFSNLIEPSDGRAFLLRELLQSQKLIMNQTPVFKVIRPAVRSSSALVEFLNPPNHKRPLTSSVDSEVTRKKRKTRETSVRTAMDPQSFILDTLIHVHGYSSLEEACNIESALQAMEVKSPDVEIIMGAVFLNGTTSFRSNTTKETRKLAKQFCKETGKSLDNDAVALIICSDQHKKLMLPLQGVYSVDVKVRLEALFLALLQLPLLVFHGKQILRMLCDFFGWNHIVECQSLTDVLLASWLLPDSNEDSQFELPQLQLQYTSVAASSQERDYLSFQEYLTCACAFADEDLTQNIRVTANAIIAQLGNLKLIDVYRSQELPLCHVLATMEHRGVWFDSVALESSKSALEKQLSYLEEAAYALVGRKFQLTSPEQCSRILFTDLKLPKVSVAGERAKVNKDIHSTGEKVLSQLAKCHQLPEILLTHRKLSKYMNTWITPFISSSGDKKDTSLQVIHTTWNQHLVATGRLSSTSPNLQNLPRDEMHFESSDVTGDSLSINIRKAFVATPDAYHAPASRGRLFISLDYMQMELRILAFYCKDENLLGLLSQDDKVDCYVEMAKEYLNCTDATQADRQHAKTISLGVLYGMGGALLCQSLNLKNDKEARSLLVKWHNAFPAVRTLKQAVLKSVRACGFVTTISGRKRFLKDINSTNSQLKASAERKAFNTLIQGSGADMLKRAMLQIYRDQALLQAGVFVSLQLHDELILSCPADKVSLAATRCAAIMANVLPSPTGQRNFFAVRGSVGPNLGEMKPLKINYHTL